MPLRPRRTHSVAGSRAATLLLFDPFPVLVARPSQALHPPDLPRLCQLWPLLSVVAVLIAVRPLSPALAGVGNGRGGVYQLHRQKLLEAGPVNAPLLPLVRWPLVTGLILSLAATGLVRAAMVGPWGPLVV